MMNQIAKVWFWPQRFGKMKGQVGRTLDIPRDSGGLYEKDPSC